jgi:hypothetical protein
MLVTAVVADLSAKQAGTDTDGYVTHDCGLFQA